MYGLGKPAMLLPDITTDPKCRTASIDKLIKDCAYKGDKTGQSLWGNAPNKQCRILFNGSGDKFRAIQKLPKCKAPIKLTAVDVTKTKAKPGAEKSADHPATIEDNQSFDYMTQTAREGEDTTAPGMSNTMKYALIGGGVLLAGLGAFLVLGKKKTATANKRRKRNWDLSNSDRSANILRHQRRRARRARRMR